MSETWQLFDLQKLKNALSDDPVSYREFLQVESMHCGLYHLKAGSKDMQNPHDEDEMYFVLEGRAKLSVDGSTQDVAPGTLLYVKASAEHTFFEIEEDMTLLVIFA